MRYLTWTGLAALGAAAPAVGAACAGDRCNAPLLEEIVVTARRAPRVVLDASETIGVIDREQLARSTAYGLADVMRSMPGVQVTDSGQPGLKRVRIRGEESRRTAILIDGQEVTDHWEVGTPLSLNPAMVERIEVVRGSGSVLYGPRALSGVVNFITRKGGTEPLQLEASSGWNSATRGDERFASVFGDAGGLEYRVAAADSEHGKRDTPQGKIENTAFDNQSVYAWAGRDFGAQRLEFAYDRYESATGVFVEEEERTTFPLTDFRIDVPRRDREKLALFYEWREVASFLPVVKANFHRQWNQREFDTFSATLVPGAKPVATERSIFSDAELEVDDGVLQLDWTPHADHYVVSGLQYTEERVNQERHVDTVTNGVTGRPEDIHDEAAIETVALFAQDEWRVAERTTLTLGARQYRVEGRREETNRAGLAPATQSDAQLIASLGLSHELGDNLVLRASVAQGYVYPSLLQFATGAYAASRYVNPNPDLEAETALSWEGGLRARAADWVFDAGVFRTGSEDYIDHVFCAPSDGCLSARDKIYVNIGESTAEGLELYAARAGGDAAWRPYASLTWMRRENRYESFVTEDSGTPGVSGTLGVSWEPPFAASLDGWIDLALRGETASRREEPSSSGLSTLEEDDAWVTLNLSGGLQFGAARRLGLVVELENLGDETYSTSAENLLAPGRSVSARVTLALD
jgi:hemoglobin/transferrin/lactoferrin receptor protein